MKKVLVTNGNYTDIRLIKALKKLGLYTITSGNDPSLAGHKYSDEYVCHDYSDKEGMLNLAKRIGIDYVASCSNDFGAMTAAYIAEKMNLPGHDLFSTTQVITEKDCFKKFAQDNQLMVIPSKGFSDYHEACMYAKEQKYPIIVKPTDLGGGKGISRVDNPNLAEMAISKAFEKSKAKHVVIEPFIDGELHGFCAFLVNKKVAIYTGYNTFEAKNNPYLVGYTTGPSDDLDNNASILIDQTEKMADLLNLVDGLFYIQYFIYEGKPIIIECMRRCMGNHELRMTSHMLGIEMEEWIAKAYCGINCEQIKEYAGKEPKHYTCHYYIQAPRNGIIRNLIISDKLKQYEFDRYMKWHDGMEITNYSTEMLGFLFLEFPDKETRDKIVSEIEQYIEVNMY